MKVTRVTIIDLECQQNHMADMSCSVTSISTCASVYKNIDDGNSSYLHSSSPVILLNHAQEQIQSKLVTIEKRHSVAEEAGKLNGLNGNTPQVPTTLYSMLLSANIELSAVKTHQDFFPDNEKMNKTKDLNDKLKDDIKKKVKKIVDAIENV